MSRVGGNPNIKKVQKKSTSKEVRERAEKTKAINRSIKNEVQEEFKNLLLDESSMSVDKNAPYYKKFISKSLKNALSNTNSKSAQYIMSLIIPENTLKELDEEHERKMAKDIDFMKYRIIKTLFDKQRDILLDDKIRYKVIMCSRRAGKTEDAKRILIDQCVEPNSPCYYVNLTFSNAIAQCYDGCIELAKEIGLTIKSEDRTNGYIEFDNGSSIRFRGNANKTEQEKIRGFKARLVIIDESQSQKGLKYLVDDIISPLLMDYTDSKLILQGTPPRIAHTYFENAFIEAQNGKDSKTKAYSWSMLDNPYIENVDEEIDRICQRKGITRDNSLIQREYLGKIAYDIEAMPFKGYKTYDKIPSSFKPTDCAIGCDWGFADYNAIVPLLYDRVTKQGYVIKTKKFNKSTITDIINECRDTYEYVKKIAMTLNPMFDLSRIGFYCDTNEESITYELATTYNLPAYNAYKYDKSMATEQLADYCRSGRILTEENDELVKEYEQIVYKRDEEDNILPEIDDDIFHPDSESALLYASRQFAFDCGETNGGESKDKKDKQQVEKDRSTLPTWLQGEE